MRNFFVITFLALAGCSSLTGGEYKGFNLVNDELGLNNWELYKKDRSFERRSHIEAEPGRVEIPYRGEHHIVNDYDCADFPSQYNAQLVFIEAGGPSKDPFNLDGDRDGFACEFNPKRYIKQYYRSKTVSNCHYVRSYYRKDGTYVRGHRRCR